MQHPRRGEFTRGTSVLAALVFVAVLSVVAYAVHSIVPSDYAAQTASARLALDSDTSQPITAAPEAAPKLGTVLLGAQRCKSPIEVQQDANAEATFDPKQDVVNICVPGCVYDIAEFSGATVVSARDLCTVNADGTGPACTVKSCLVRVCDESGECNPVASSAASQVLGKATGVAEEVKIKSSPDLQAALASGSQADVNKLPPYLQEVFKAEQKEVIQNNESAIQNHLDAIREIGSASPTEVQKHETEIARLQQQNQRLASLTIAKPEDAGSLTPGPTVGLESSGSPYDIQSVTPGAPSNPTFGSGEGSKAEQPATALDKLKALSKDCPANTSCPPGGLPVLKFPTGGGIAPNTDPEFAGIPPQFTGEWKPSISKEVKDYAGTETDEDYTRRMLGVTDGENKSVTISPGAEGDGKSTDTKQVIAGSMTPQEREAFLQANMQPQKGIRVTTPGDYEKYAKMGWLCRPLTNTIGSGELECIPPVNPRPTAPAQGPCPDGSIIRPNGTCPSPGRTGTGTGAGTGTGTVTGAATGTTRQPAAPAPAPRTQNTPNVWEQGINNFLKGFIQATVSSNPFGGGFGQQGYGQGYGQGGYGGGQPPIGNSNPLPPGTCGVAMYCQNNMQYQRNTQCVDQPMQACQYGCNGNQCATAPQNQCPPPPQQPPAAACSGTWQQESTPGPSGLSCVTGWTCAPNTTAPSTTTPGATTTPSTTTERPTAELSCAPAIADAGMSVSISYACGNAASSTARNFSTGGALSGTATAIAPNSSTSTTYALLCESEQGLRASAACTVQIARPSIVFVVNPQQVLAGQGATVGWVTSGMKSCVVSSPDSAAFTSQNAGKTETSGTAQTPPLTSTMRLSLSCETVGGNTKSATTTATLKQDGTPPTSMEENNGYCLAVAANSSQRLFLINRGYQCDAAPTNTSCSRLKGPGECI